MNPTDNHSVRNIVSETDDSGKQQTVKSTGRKNETLGGQASGPGSLPKAQSYGRSYHQPKGSHGMTTMMNGDPDQTIGHTYEHPDYRPTGLKEGEWKDYEKWGGYLHATETEWHLKKGESEIWIKADGTIHLKGVKIILEVTDKVYIGGEDATLEVAMRGSLDNDSESNGADALVDALATKAVVK